MKFRSLSENGGERKGLPAGWHPKVTAAGATFKQAPRICRRTARPKENSRRAGGEENLAARPRYILVADQRLRFGCEKPERWRPIEEALKRDYRLLAHATGERDAYDVFERMDSPAGWGLRP